MNKYELRFLTVAVVFVFTAALCIFDWWMSWVNNDATISKINLWLAHHAPLLPMTFAFWAGGLCGHLFWPQDPLSNDDQ